MDQSILVLKFGGTSVKDLEAMRKAVELSVSQNYEYVLVVSSAVSGITNKLVFIADQLKNNNHKVDSNLNEVVEIHLSMADQLQQSGSSIDLHLNLLEQLKEDVLKLKSQNTISDASYARLVGYGELLSTSLLISLMQGEKANAVWYDIREVMKTDELYIKAHPDFEMIGKNAREILIPLLHKHKMVITQGFIGSCQSGETTLLGRGGSDYSATILGAALPAQQVEIWTDVDGLMTTDPRIVPDAKTIFDITYEEASELAYFGAKVLHPLTLRPAREKGIPVMIRNSHNSTHPGTRIHVKIADDNYKGAKAIAFKRNITILNIISSRMLMAYGFLYKVFKIFDAYKTPVDIVATSEVSISVTIDDTTQIDAICEELKEIGKVEISKGQTLVSVVGTGIRNLKGTAAKVFGAIRNINVNMISQGASQTNLSFIIDDDNLEQAVKQLHKELIELNPAFIKQETEICA
jgi:aspartate kinase